MRSFLANAWRSLGIGDQIALNSLDSRFENAIIESISGDKLLLNELLSENSAADKIGLLRVTRDFATAIDLLDDPLGTSLLDLGKRSNSLAKVKALGERPNYEKAIACFLEAANSILSAQIGRDSGIEKTVKDKGRVKGGQNRWKKYEYIKANLVNEVARRAWGNLQTGQHVPRVGEVADTILMIESTYPERYKLDDPPSRAIVIKWLKKLSYYPEEASRPGRPRSPNLKS